MFFVFSSASNAIHPALLGDQLGLIGYTSTSRPESSTTSPTGYSMWGLCVRHSCLQYGGSTGNSAGPFPVHPVHCRLLSPISPQPLQKFSDNSILCLIRDGDDRAHRELIKVFLDQRNHIQLNVGKTKELVVDFRRHRQPCTQVNIQGTDIEMVASYQYLGVHMNNNLDWNDPTAAAYKVRADLIYRGSSGPLECRWHSGQLSMTLWWHQLFSME